MKRIITKNPVENEPIGLTSYDVKICDLPFRIRSSRDEETVKALVQFVDKSIQDSLATTKSGSLQNAAVLAALNIAEELILLKRQAAHQMDRLEAKVLELSEEFRQIPEV